MGQEAPALPALRETADATGSLMLPALSAWGPAGCAAHAIPQSGGLAQREGPRGVEGCLPACPKVDTNKGGTFCGGEKLWDSAFSLLKTGADKGAYGMAINPSS